MIKKYQQTGKTFQIVESNKRITVTPINGELLPNNPKPSWSAGFTHYVDIDGKIGFCGQEWFENNAIPTAK